MKFRSNYIYEVPIIILKKYLFKYTVNTFMMLLSMPISFICCKYIIIIV